MKAESRLMKWRLPLAEFDFNVLYCSGVNNSVPDALSMVETTDGDCGTLEDEIRFFVAEDHESHDWDFADGETDDLDSLQQPVFAVVRNPCAESIHAEEWV